VQKEILLLLIDLQQQMQNTIVFVSHDMGVHYQLTHKMLIMYAAKAVEYADTEAIFREPLHPYTLMLTNSLPTIGDDRARQGLPGRPPSLWNPTQGCRFAPRCPLATDLCRAEEPLLLEHRPGRFSACHFAESVPQLKQTLQQAPTLSEIAHDETKLQSMISNTLKLDNAIAHDVKSGEVTP
jgi:peptide/nickel transport system ATP-binding protein